MIEDTKRCHLYCEKRSDWLAVVHVFSLDNGFHAKNRGAEELCFTYSVIVANVSIWSFRDESLEYSFAGWFVMDSEDESAS